MKRNHTTSLLAVFTLAFLFTGCLKDDCKTTRTFLRFDPVYMSLSEIRKDVRAEAPRAMKNPGKIYYYQNYLMINEIREGIHVIDNSDPANPKPIAFWSIPGNVDFAVRGTSLFADQFVDLLTVDVSDFQNPVLKCRSENVFSLYGFDPYRGYLVEYEATEVTEKLDCEDSRFNNNWWRIENGGGIFVNIDVAFDNSAGPGGGQGGNSAIAQATGVSGSYSRMTFMGQYLYAIDNMNLYPFQIDASGCPVKQNTVSVGWNIETIFPWEDRFFIGSQNGVFIFNAKNPLQPVYESSFWHATGCDPVVCDEKYAYVTIHGGTTCNGQEINQLDIIGISALPATSLLKTYSMKKPFGLALSGDILYLCDDGLKIYDKSNIENLKLLAHLPNITTYDVIALDHGVLMIIGADGFYQYDTSDPANPKKISHLPVQR